jgi:hypothetical protein
MVIPGPRSFVSNRQMPGPVPWFAWLRPYYSLSRYRIASSSVSSLNWDLSESSSVVNSLPVRSLNCSLNELVRFY